MDDSARTTLLIVRHGETLWNIERRFQGHEDSPLTARGKAQADALGKRLSRTKFDAMIASGSIPFVLDAVDHIAAAREGLYWDGGITDYHFDLPFNDLQGLVLYPHFQGAVIPGWFDKKLAWRRAHKENYDNVVLLCPSAEFVAGLPGGKLSDRTDFERLDYPERVAVFQQVLEQSKILVDELRGLIDKGITDQQIRPIGNLK